MRRPFTILAVIGIFLTCGLIFTGVLLHREMQTGTLVHIGGVGPVGFLLFRDGIYVTYHNMRRYHFDLFYPATAIAALPLAYLILLVTRRRQEKRHGFPISMPTPPDPH